LGPGSRNLNQNDHKPTPLMILLTKKLKPKTQNYFFMTDSKTNHIFSGFEQLSSALAEELWSCKVIPFQHFDVW